MIAPLGTPCLGGHCYSSLTSQLARIIDYFNQLDACTVFPGNVQARP